MKEKGIIFGCFILIYSFSLAFFAPLHWTENKASVEYGGVSAEELSLLASTSHQYHEMSNEINSISWPSLKNLECEACKFIAGLMQSLFRLNQTDDFIAEAAKFWCIKLKIEDTRVCSTVIPEFRNEVLTVFDEVGLDPKEVCGLILGPSCSKVRQLYPDWNVTFPNIPKPPVHVTPLPKVSFKVYIF